MARFRYSTSVVLQDDGSGFGTGTIRLAPSGRSWRIEYMTLRCSTQVLEASGRVYENYIGEDYLIDSTFAASSGDTTDTVMHVPDGSAVIVEWIRGDIGAVATVTYTGEET